MSITNIDIRLLSVLISASVSIVILLVKEFIFDSWKRNKERKREQLKNFYAPLYVIILGRIHLAGRPSFGLSLGDTTDYFLSKDHMNDFLLNNAGYASDKLLEIWIDYQSDFTPELSKSRNLIYQVVKEYNQLKKQLRQNYSKGELETGIPDQFKEYRRNSYHKK
ncbi:MAG: hypothetical protein WBV93_00435 [Anaerobacillus sp.]